MKPVAEGSAVSGSIRFDRLAIPGLPIDTPIEFDFAGSLRSAIVLDDHRASQSTAPQGAEPARQWWAFTQVGVHSKGFQFEIPDPSSRARPSHLTLYIVTDATSAAPASTIYDEFMALVYRMEETTSDLHAMEIVVDKLDDLLNADDFESCKAMLLSADPDRMSDALVVSFLGITLAAKKKLAPEREIFYCRAINAISARRGADGASRLLEKYH